MILSDTRIRELLKSNELVIQHKYNDELYIGPSSVDLHLDNKSKILMAEKSPTPLNLTMDSSRSFAEHNGWDELTINPGEFYILHTAEWMKFPENVAGFIQGRSSIARLGINVHAAGFFDPGFQGTATLEVTNFTKFPITIPKNTRIAQMVFVNVDGKVEVPYNKKKDSKYFGQMEPKLSAIHEDYEQ